MITPHFVMAILHFLHAADQIQRDLQAHEDWIRNAKQRMQDQQREYEILTLEHAWRLDR